MRKYIVNNQEVEYLHIEERHDGTIEIHFEEKFNLITAHKAEIIKRLRENGIEGVHVVKYIHKYKIIVIHMKSIEQLTGVLHSLDIPFGVYEVNYEDALITIDTPDYERVVSERSVSMSNDNLAGEML